MPELNQGDMRALADCIASQCLKAFLPLTFNQNGNPKEWLNQQKVTDICFEAIKEYFGA